MISIAAAIGGFTNDQLVVAQPLFPLSQFVWTANLVLLPTVAFVHRRRSFLQAVRSCSVLMIVPLFAVVSLFWSVSRVDTVVATARFVLAVAFVCAVWVLSGPRTWRNLAAAILVLAGASVLLPSIDPAAADAFADGVRGVFPQKNSLGGVAAVGLIVGLLATSSIGRPLRVGVALVSFVALALSRSATAVLACAAALAVVAFVHAYRRRTASFWALATIAPCGVAMAVLSGLWQNLPGWFGKDSTLTGRLDIWTSALAAIEQRPLTGYGYAAYWPWKLAQEGTGEVLVAITNAHNLLLDFMLAFGVFGLLPPIALLYTIARAQHSRYRAAPGTELLGVGLTVFVVLQGITEASALQPRTIGLFVLVSALIAGSRRW